MERMVTGGAGGGVPLRQSLQDLRARYGSNRAAAKALGINESIFRRAINGQTQSPGSGLRGAVDREARARASEGFTRDRVRLTITDRAPGRGGRVRRDREIGPQNMKLAPGAEGKIRDAYVAGGAGAAARAFIASVGDAHYRQWLIPEEWDGGDSDYGYSVG